MYSFDKRGLPAQQGVHKLRRWVLRSAMARLAVYELLNGGLRHSVAGKSVCKLRKGVLHPSGTYKCAVFASVICVSKRLRKACVGSRSFASRKDSAKSVLVRNYCLRLAKTPVPVCVARIGKSCVGL